jgi:hypothetical protein
MLFGRRRDHKSLDGREPDGAAALLERQILSLTLSQVSDLFDADGLWSAQHTRKSRIRDKASGNPRYRLYDHLKARKRKIHSKDPGSGRLFGVKRVFTDVVVQISPQVWTQEIRTGEPGFAILTTNLALRHREDFKRDLKAQRRAPRYVVAPAPDLALGEVRFLFGSGIFVPDDDDTLEARMSLLGPAGERLEIHDWEVYDQFGRLFQRPAGLYAEQRSICVRGPAGPAQVPHVARGWPLDNLGFVQLSRPPAAALWRAYDDGESSRCLDLDGESLSDGGRRYRFVDARGRESLSLLLVPVTPTSSAPDSPASPNAPHMSAVINEPDRAALSDDGAEPSYVLRLVGIALPRVDGAQRVRLRDGIELDGWRLWIDPLGGLADLNQTDPARLAMLTTEAATGRLLARHAGTTELVEVNHLPFQLRVNPTRSTDEMTLSPGTDRKYLGIAWLSRSPELILAYRDRPVPAPRWLGRGGGHPPPELCLDFLKQPGSMLWSRPGVSGFLGQFDLSRQQLEAVLDPPANRLEVKPPKDGSPVCSLVLGQDLEVLARLKPGDGTVQLVPGQYLQLGCYLMRFDHVSETRPAIGDQTILASLDDDRTVILTRRPMR